MYEALLQRLVNRAFLICKNNRHSQECKVAWDQIDDVVRSHRKRRHPPQKPKPVDTDLELSQREYDI